MTISGILLVNQKGETLISRFYRDNISRSAIDGFRNSVIINKSTQTPVVLFDQCSFMHMRHSDIHIVAVTKLNSNAALVLQFLSNMVDIFKGYFGGNFDENCVRDNFVVIYELLDEIMDNGYPQITSFDLLKEYIKIGSLQTSTRKSKEIASETITSEITGAVDWRQPNKYKYRRNEVFIDVLEAVNLLMSSNQQILKADVSGKIMMKTYLTGMPDCKFGMNDKLVMEREAKNNVKRRHGSGIAIDDVTFHRCVRLNRFDQDRTISFIPPDGEFELMKYRITQNVNLPFRVIPVVSEHGRTRVEYDIQIKGNFSDRLNATNVILRIPTPKNTSKCKLSPSGGKCKYKPDLEAIIWKIKRFPGDAAFTLKGEANVLASVDSKPWSRPPITMEFQVPMFTSSGLHVRFLKVFEQNRYQTIKWVRYITRGGQYQIRI